ncbi:bms1, partial [Symbiodinium necroappetens]
DENAENVEEGGNAEKPKQEDGGAPENGLLEDFSDSFPIGTFVRIRLEDVPAACVAAMRGERPLILGGLLPGESRMGLVQTRIKRHRWHPKLLKSSDALLLSVGWRRFQTVPCFSLEDRGEKRMRYLKYTLEHAHCTMTSYGPMVPPNTGILAFRSWEKVGHFRVCGTGVVMEAAPNFEVKKKLKLVGEPYKIFRNTAFVKNMFSSDLEVNKYMHAKIQTVSGIRGEVKKAEGVKGHFRASFEDRILMSDLVVCKCWITVPFKQFYHPVIDVPNWRPARLIGELRASQGIPVPDNQDSHYGRQLVRPERRFNAVQVPRSLQASLPFKAKTRYLPKSRKTGLAKKAAIVSSEREKAVNALLHRLYTIRKEKARVRQEASSRRKKAKEVKDKFIQDKRDAHQKESRKLRYKKEGQKVAQKRKAMMMD